jgi:hypothetical protein
MNIRKKLWNWCPKPKRPVSTYFTKLATPLYASILIGGLFLIAYVTVIFLPPMKFSAVDESGRVTEVVERVLFPGGAIIVYKHPVYDPYPTWRIGIKIHNYITCEEDLLAYLNSRTNALDELLRSLSMNDKVQVTITFREPLEPDHFKNLYENYFAESDGPNHSAIVAENETSGELKTIILNAPSPEFLEEFCTYPKKGLKTVSVISFEAYVRVDIAKTLMQDPRVLLVDPQECLTIRGLVKKYSLKGFNVIVDRPPMLVKVFEPELSCGTTNIEELLDNPSKYDHWRLYLAGNVSDINLLEDAFFKLNEKLTVCYKYYGIDLSEQINTEDIGNGDSITLVGTFFQERSTLYADKIEKVKQDDLLMLMVDELLANSAKYDRQTVQVFGNVSDLGSVDGPFFKLDGKIVVCYVHDDVNFYSQISGVQNEDPIIVEGRFHSDNVTLYAENLRPSKWG